MLVAAERGGGDAPVADAALFMRALGAELHGPQGPGGLRRALLRRHGQEFKLVDGDRLLAMHGAEAVGAGVAAADDDHALAGGENVFARRQDIAFAAAVLLRQKFHGEVNALQFASGDAQVARAFGAAAEQERVEVAAQVVDRDVLTDVGAGHELDAFGGELLDAAVHQMLLELEVGNAVAQQAPDAVGLFENGDLVSGAAQLLRGSKARRVRSR